MDSEIAIGIGFIATIALGAGAIAGLITKRLQISQHGWVAPLLAFGVAYAFGLVGAGALILGWWLVDRQIFSRPKVEDDSNDGDD